MLVTLLEYSIRILECLPIAVISILNTSIVVLVEDGLVILTDTCATLLSSSASYVERRKLTVVANSSIST